MVLRRSRKTDGKCEMFIAVFAIAFMLSVLFLVHLGVGEFGRCKAGSKCDNQENLNSYELIDSQKHDLPLV